MACEGKKTEHFRSLHVIAFDNGSKAEKAARDICAVHSEGAIAERTARDCYVMFKDRNFDLIDAPRSGRQMSSMKCD